MIVRKNFRYRHPISAEILNTYLEEIMEEFIFLLGANNTIYYNHGIITEHIYKLETIEDLELTIDDYTDTHLYTEKYNRSK